MLFVSLCISLYNVVDSIPTVAQLDQLPVIVIDPGHGGIDGGAVAGDIIEKDINLSISLMLRDIFVVNGFEVVMTRESDVSIHDEGVTGTRKQKVSDLHNRLKIASEYPNAVFISIHQNKFGSSSSWGTQVFYSPNNPASSRLAEILQAYYIKNLQPDNSRLTKKAGKNLYLMTEATCPAVLVECGFLSNAEEAGKLVDPEYQSLMAFTTFCGVMEYLEMNQPIPSSTALEFVV